MKRYWAHWNDQLYVADKNGDLVMAEDFDRVTAERDALQQLLNVADERRDLLEGLLAARDSELEEFSIEMTLAITDSQIRSAMTVIGRSRFLQLLQAYNARIDAALKPAATHPCPVSLDGCDGSCKPAEGGGDEA